MTFDLTSVEKFLVEKQPNAWIDIGPHHVYVRRAKHLLLGAVVSTFDIATIDTPEELRGQGSFRRLIPALVKLLTGKFSYIYIENVLNPRLERALPGMGFICLEGVFTPPCFYLPLNHELT